jgi:dipeptidyl aminopeptidase/acylaminoacyl peptidase
MRHVRHAFIGAIALVLAGAALESAGGGLATADLYRLRSVGEVSASPDGSRIAYSVQNSDRPGRPYSQVWLIDAAGGAPARLGSDRDSASGPRWSADGRRIAFFGREDDQSGLMVAQADGSGITFLAEVKGTNHPLPSSGERLAWSPDGRRIAFVSATPGPEQDANGDPMVITRYLYKPTASEGLTRFNDNRRLHVFIVDLDTKAVRQLTDGIYYEHSIDWSPRGDEILFISNRGPDPDRFFNYDLFAVTVAEGRVRRLSDTKSAEYRPRWSPDGRRIALQATKRPLTSSETTMEDTHVWVMDADGRNRREVGAGIDNRQGAPDWSADGARVFFTVQERGSTRLYSLPAAGGAPSLVTPETGSIGSWSLLGGDRIAYSLATPARPAELVVRPIAKERAASPLTNVNQDALAGKAVADVEAFTFKSFDGTPIEAFVTRPLDATPGSKHPLIVMIHGGPHGQQGPAFNTKAQIYASQGWGTLMVNYRGSTGYGQKLTDAIFKDQNGGEAKDVLAGVDAALAKYAWIDPARLGIEGGSYGGQLTNWIVTQTDRFRAAVPAASIANLISFNYMAYYHDYLAVEFGSFPHENGLMDLLWERSPIRYVHRVRTPTMLLHGENDNDVPIAEAEQFYIALKDVGVETVMIRYPREGHGIRETKHVADTIDRSIAWYRKQFAAAAAPTPSR